MLDQNQDFPEKEPFVNNVRFYRRLAEEAPHSVRWYRRVMSLAPRIVCAELFCTVILLGCDFALTAFGRTTDGPIAGLIAGLVPGSMTAHLIFTLTRRAFFPLWGRAGRILAAAGALAIVSIHLRIARDSGYPFGHRRFIILLFAEAGAAVVNILLSAPFGEPSFWAAAVGIALRVGAAAFLMYADTCPNWGDGAEETAWILWAAEKYHWPDDYVLDENTLPNEDWMRIVEEYKEAHQKRRRIPAKRIDLLRYGGKCGKE